MNGFHFLNCNLQGADNVVFKMAVMHSNRKFIFSKAICNNPVVKQQI